MKQDIKNANEWQIARLQIAYDRVSNKIRQTNDDEDLHILFELAYRIGEKLDDIKYELKHLNTYDNVKRD